MPELFFPFQGIDERKDAELIRYYNESRRNSQCPSCSHGVEYHTFSNLSAVFCPYCSAKIKVS